MFQQLQIISEPNKDPHLHRAYILVVVRNSVYIFLVEFVSIKCFTFALVLLYWKIKTNKPGIKTRYLHACI